MRFTLVTLCFLIANPVFALSCMLPSVELLYTSAERSEALFLPVYGTIKIQTPPQRKLDANGMPLPSKVDGQFVGRVYGRYGKGEKLSVPVTVQTTCIASWCGSFHFDDGPILAMLEKRDNSFVLYRSACENTVISNPNADQLKRFRGCLRTGKCDPYR